MRKMFRENGLSIVLGLLFFVTLFGQTIVYFTRSAERRSTIKNKSSTDRANQYLLWRI